MPKKAKASQHLTKLDKQTSVMFDGDHMSNYQEIFDEVIQQSSELGDMDHIDIGHVSQSDDYFFDPEGVTPLVKIFLNKFFSVEIKGFDKLLEHQEFRHNQMKGIRSYKLEYTQDIIIKFDKLKWKKLNHQATDFMKSLKEIQTYLKAISPNLSDDAQVICENIDLLLQIMVLNLDPALINEQLRDLKIQLNKFISKIESQNHRYKKEIQNNDGSPALCLSFLLVTLSENDKQCLVSISSPELNQSIYLTIKGFIRQFNAENEEFALMNGEDFVPFKLLAPSSENFDRLVQAINTASSGECQINISKKCAEKPLASSLMKFLYRHPMELKGESLCNIQFYPFKEGFKYGVGSNVKEPLDSSYRIRLDNGLYVPSIPCCHDCKSMKNPVIKLWRTAKQKGASMLSRECALEVEHKLTSCSFFKNPRTEEPPIAQKIMPKNITSPVKESPFKKRRIEDSKGRGIRIPEDYSPIKTKIIFSLSNISSEAPPLEDTLLSTTQHTDLP